MREYHKFVTPGIRLMLEGLLHKSAPEEYRRLMTDLGAELAHGLILRLGRNDRILLICTNEDADFLAKGMLEALEQCGYNHINLACFWNERKRVGAELDIAPIIRRYVEPTDAVDVFIVVKSILSSACTIRTNISEMVYQKDPKRILIAAPVIYDKAISMLEAEFDKEIVEKFEYFWLAKDDERKSDGEVVPGIGGSIYELLGIGTSETKNRYIPELVKARRATVKI